MATCKECLHAEVCYFKAFNDVRALEKRRNDVEKICKSFVGAAESARGRWAYNTSTGTYSCPKCRKNVGVVRENFCPKCGADLREVDDGTN